jgi:hypothetical protein
MAASAAAVSAAVAEASAAAEAAPAAAAHPEDSNLTDFMIQKSFLQFQEGAFFLRIISLSL